MAHIGYKDQIRSNWTELVGNLDAHPLCDHLYERKIITEYERESISQYAASDRAKAIRKILDCVCKKSDFCVFEDFVDILRKLEYEHLVEKLIGCLQIEAGHSATEPKWVMLAGDACVSGCEDEKTVGFKTSLDDHDTDDEAFYPSIGECKCVIVNEMNSDEMKSEPTESNHSYAEPNQHPMDGDVNDEIEHHNEENVDSTTPEDNQDTDDEDPHPSNKDSTFVIIDQMLPVTSMSSHREAKHPLFNGLYNSSSLRVDMIGSSNIGKTCFTQCCSGICYEKVGPTYECAPSTYTFNMRNDERALDFPVKLDDYDSDLRVVMLDVPGTKIRKGKLKNNDVELLIGCIAVDDQDSIRDLEERWTPYMDPVIPVMFVVLGLRADRKHTFTQKDGDDLCKRLHADLYIECSAKADAPRCAAIFEWLVNETARRYFPDYKYFEDESLKNHMFPDKWSNSSHGAVYKGLEFLKLYNEVMEDRCCIL